MSSGDRGLAGAGDAQRAGKTRQGREDGGGSRPRGAVGCPGRPGWALERGSSRGASPSAHPPRTGFPRRPVPGRDSGAPSATRVQAPSLEVTSADPKPQSHTSSLPKYRLLPSFPPPPPLNNSDLFSFCSSLAFKIRARSGKACPAASCTSTRYRVDIFPSLPKKK